MNPEHIGKWREYLAVLLQERCGVAEQEAQKAVTQWLRSLNREPEPHRSPAPARTQRQRPGSPARLAVRKTRSARA